MAGGRAIRSRTTLIALDAVLMAVTLGVGGCLTSGDGGTGGSAGDPGGNNGAPPTTTQLSVVVSSGGTGIAPLGVFFDASATTIAGAAFPIHQARYQWTFGDGAAGTWGDASTGSAGTGNASYASRNIAEGVVAAHVYQTPGVYTATLTVTYNGAVVGTKNAVITVTDPAATLTTYCIAAAGLPVAGADGCPLGAAVATQSDWPTIVQTYALAGNRVLLKHGDTFTDADGNSNHVSIHNAGPGIIGAYGPGYNGEPGVAGAKPVIAWTGAETVSALLQLSNQTSPTAGNWRIMDLDFEGGAATLVSAITWGGTFNNAVILRNVFNHVYYGVNPDSNIGDYFNSHGAPGHTMIANVFVQDNTGTNFYARAMYSESWYTALMGNDFDNVVVNGEHVVRMQICRYCVINHNELRRPGSVHGFKEVLTVRAAVHGVTANPYAGGPPSVDGGLDSQYIVISDNLIHAGENGNQLALTNVPQAADDERVIDVLTERNVFDAPGNSVQVFIHYASYGYATIRNNICIGTGGHATALTCVNVSEYSSPATETPQYVWVYNNTMYASDAGANSYGVNVSNVSGVGNIVVANNLVWTPAKTAGYYGAACNGSANLASCLAASDTFANNSTIAQVHAVTGPFVSAAPAAVTDFRPCSPNSADCYAAGGGYSSLPSSADFFGAARTGTWDMGAINH